MAGEANTWRDLLRPGAWRRLPPSVYIALTTKLFGIKVSITCTEAFLVALVGGLAAWEAKDAFLAGATIIATLLVLSLVPLAARFHKMQAQGMTRNQVRVMELRFEAIVCSASLAVGLMNARALLAFDDISVHLTLLLLGLGSMITNIRDHYRPFISFGKTVMMVVPVAVAGMLTGNFLYQVIGFAAIVAGKMIVDICLELYDVSLALHIALKRTGTMAEKLEIQNDSLQRREMERQVAEAELKRLQGELVQVSRLSAMGAMASTLAHELNQPLTAVANYARGSRRLLETPSDARIAQAAEGIAAAETGALRAGQIVRRIRNLVYRGDARTRPESLAEIVREASGLALVDARLLGIEYSIELDDGGDWVAVDAIQIQQVLINLMRNAVEAVQTQGDPHIAITSHASEEVVEIGVADNGPGISEEVAADLFSPFNSTKTGGLGLGLSLSRTIIEAHGGKIWLVPGARGAKFCFTLPRATPPEEEGA